MRRIYYCGCMLLLAVLTSNGRASILVDFESGSFPSGWTVSPSSAWTVGGTTGNLNQITPSDGSYFARSGGPNMPQGDPDSEYNAGTVTSVPYTVTFDTLKWLSAGWSGLNNDGKNHFEILNAALVSVWTVPAAQGDPWITASVNLISDAGLSPGDTFYFRAVDGKAEPHYAWIAFDKLELTGTELEVGAVPEATSFLIWGLLALTLAVGSSHRRLFSA